MFANFEAKKGALVIIDEGEDSRLEEELSSDLPALLTVFPPRLFGSCTLQCWEPIDDVRTSLMAALCF